MAVSGKEGVRDQNIARFLSSGRRIRTDLERPQALARRAGIAGLEVLRERPAWVHDKAVHQE